VTVQQGELTSTNNNKNMTNFYFDTVASGIPSVDRALHDGAQFVRLVMKRPKPVTAYTGTTARINAPALIDGLFTPNPTANVTNMTIGFGGLLVSTHSIKVYSTAAIDTTIAAWTIATSLTNIESEFTSATFQPPISSITQAIVSTSAGNEFLYTINIGTAPIDSTGNGLPFWRITHTGTGPFSNVTEVQIIPPLTPTISYFNTDGSFASSLPFAQPNILDACFDVSNNRFITIRYNSGTLGTPTVTLSDDFDDDNAGTASGTNNFNPSRWITSNVNTQFLRVAGNLSFNTAAGNGQIDTTYSLGGDLNVNLSILSVSATDKKMWMQLRFLDSNNNTIMGEGVGFDPVTTSGVWFANEMANIVNSTSSSSLLQTRPLWHNTASGTDSYTIAFVSGNTWSVSGTLTGALPNATTGVNYDETVAPTSPITFLISSTANPNSGDNFTFDLFTNNVKKAPTATGVLGLRRTGSNYTTYQVITSPRTVVTTPMSIEIFGHTDGSVNIQADTLNVVTGSGIFQNVAVFTVERVDVNGNVIAPPLISAFDVIGDPTLTYDSFLGGRVQVAATSSGSGGGFIYIKYFNTLYTYPNNVSLGFETGSSATTTTIAQINKDGTSSFNWTTSSNGIPFLTYLEFDSVLNIPHLKTINKDTLQNTTNTKQALLNISDYAVNAYKVFYDQNDFNTLYYIDAGNNLRSWNLNDTISAFMAVNAQTVTLPAGTAQQTAVNADVINAWGQILAGKTVTFAVTAGDGAVTPASSTTNGSGRAATTFTVGNTVGVSTVTATVTA